MPRDDGPSGTVPLPPGTIEFQEKLLKWYEASKRDLPWRGDPDPYHILVSEVMLQQTQVERVIPKYRSFLLTFPSLNTLSEATTADVIRAWQGLGYNRRALNLKRAAERVSEEGGDLPQTVKELQELPGIGTYTARAVACFAFDAQVAVVDTNVRRVLSQWTGRDLSLRETWELATQILPAGRAADWNQALMDYGALVAKTKQPRLGKRSEPFATTNRFWRGRIIDVLREHAALSLTALLSELPYPERDETRVRSLVLTLQEEGLVTYNTREDTVFLPS